MNRPQDLEDQLSEGSERLRTVADELASAHPLATPRSSGSRGRHPLVLSAAVVAVVALGVAGLVTYRYRSEVPASGDIAVSTVSPIERDSGPTTTSGSATTLQAEATITLPTTLEVQATHSEILFASLQDDTVVFADIEGSILRSVALPTVAPGFERALVHANDETAYVADGGRLIVVGRSAISEPTVYDGYSSIGPVSDSGFWRSEAGARPGFVSWRFESFARETGPTIELEISQLPFGQLSDGLAVWDRERSQVLYASSQSQTVLSSHVPLTSSDDTVFVLDDSTVTAVDEFGDAQPLFDLRGAVPASTLEATAVSPDHRRLAILRKDPNSYDVLDLTVFDLDTMTESAFAIDEGARAQWISASSILVHADRPTAIVVRTDSSDLVETHLAGRDVIAIETS